MLVGLVELFHQVLDRMFVDTGRLGVEHGSLNDLAAGLAPLDLFLLILISVSDFRNQASRADTTLGAVKLMLGHFRDVAALVSDSSVGLRTYFSIELGLLQLFVLELQLLDFLITLVDLFEVSLLPLSDVVQLSNELGILLGTLLNALLIELHVGFGLFTELRHHLFQEASLPVNFLNQFRLLLFV